MQFRKYFLFSALVASAAALSLCQALAAAAGAPIKILREGQAKYRVLDPAKLPPGTPTGLFAAEVAGNTFELFVRNLEAQALNIELGFVDTESTAAQQHTFSIAANGTPVDANLDVWFKAGGAFKPWVMKTAFTHAGGSLTLLFTGLDKPAFVSYARLTDAGGRELAVATAKDWEKSERLTLLDSRSRPFHEVKVGEVPFYNVDHSPVGCWSSFLYGMENSGGVQVCKQPGGEATLVPNQGVIIAVKNGATERLMPFAVKQPSLPAEAVIKDKEVARVLRACTDRWEIPLGVSWNHYTPVWTMRDWEKATDAEKRRFVLPATFMQYHIDNRGGKDETQLLFSLAQASERATGLKGFDGYVVAQDSTIAVKAGDAELLSADQAKRAFGVDGATSAFCVHVPPGTEKSVTFYVVQYQPGELPQLEMPPLKFMCAALFADVNDVLKTAESSLPAVVSRCEEVDKQVASCGQDAERKFLAGDTLHSYQYNTVLLATGKNEPIWAVIEGECAFTNTFDLTVDHVFYELAMHPWTVRNELDLFTKTFSYDDELSLPGQTQRFPGGLGFCHDMGTRVKFSTHEKGAAYPRLMTQEELQNWILCAALYWKTTGDNAWLERNQDIFRRALKSMQLRDDLDPAKRDGITTYTSSIGERAGEITTYDAMDASLQHPVNSLYITVKSFACYLMLKPVFLQLGDAVLAKESAAAVEYTKKGLLSHWDENRQVFPAIFEGKSPSVIIPAIEGLVYPYVMGLKQEVAPDGPNGELISRLKTHLKTILVPGVCLDAQTGAWNLSSTSSTTWTSKVYLNQFVAESILGLITPVTGQQADRAHYAYEVLGAPAVCWTDQIYTSSHLAYGCRHYPRGVTSALWWLWPAPMGR